MLDRLAAGEATLTELAAPFNMTLPAVAKHLRVLEQSGLVVRDETTGHRYARILPSGFEEVGAWLGQREEFRAGGLARLRTFIEAGAKRHG